MFLNPKKYPTQEPSQSYQHDMEKETKNSTFPHPKNQETMQ